MEGRLHEQPQATKNVHAQPVDMNQGVVLLEGKGELGREG